MKKKQRNTKKTTKEFIDEVYERVASEYTVKGDYITKDVKISFLHNTCGFEFLMTPHNFLSGNRCPQCAKELRKINTRISKEDFIERFKKSEE